MGSKFIVKLKNRSQEHGNYFDIMRNRFMVICGFPCRLHKMVQAGEEKLYNYIIFNELPWPFGHNEA